MLRCTFHGYSLYVFSRPLFAPIRGNVLVLARFLYISLHSLFSLWLPYLLKFKIFFSKINRIITMKFWGNFLKHIFILNRTIFKYDVNFSDMQTQKLYHPHRPRNHSWIEYLHQGCQQNKKECQTLKARNTSKIDERTLIKFIIKIKYLLLLWLCIFPFKKNS